MAQRLIKSAVQMLFSTARVPQSLHGSIVVASRRCGLRPFRPRKRLTEAYSVGLCVRAAVLMLIAVLAPLGAPKLSLAAPGNHYVFAHYMVCCSFDGHEATVEQFEQEMRKAMRFGIDGFALNCGGWLKEPTYPAVSQRLFDAADKLDGAFK